MFESHILYGFRNRLDYSPYVRLCPCPPKAEIPIQVIFPALFSTIIYLLVGFPLEAGTFFLFMLYVVLTSNAAISLG